MTERNFLRYSLRSPNKGYTFRCLPYGPSYRYYPATKCVFPEWAAPEYSEAVEYRHGSILQGGLTLGQHPVTHSALSGDVVFELPALPLSGAGNVVRLSTSLTFGLTGMYGAFGTSGVKRDDGKIVQPYSGTFKESANVGNFVLQSLAYSLPYVHPTGWTDGEVGYKYSGFKLSPKSVTYTMSNRNWQASMTNGRWMTAAGYREEWNVSVVYDSTGFHGRAYTTLRETVVAYLGDLVWSAVPALQDNWDFAEYKIAKVTSSAVEASILPIIAFDVIVQGARLWAARDDYEVERIQVHNDALDSFRALRSNNVENALQMTKISKLLPLEAARLVPHIRAELMPQRKALLVAKFASGIYLWWRYVVKTTYNDLGEILKAIPSLYPKEGPVSLKAKVSAEREFEFPNTTWVAETIRVSPYNLTLLPLRLGLHPGLAQVWDLVPFSFVVDWAYGISNQLNAIDWFIYKTFMKLHYIVSSRKTVVTVDASAYGGAGEVKIAFYVRSVSASWPGFSDSIPFPRWVPIKNWAPAAAALAIANVRLKRG